MKLLEKGWWLVATSKNECTYKKESKFITEFFYDIIQHVLRWAEMKRRKTIALKCKYTFSFCERPRRKVLGESVTFCGSQLINNIPMHWLVNTCNVPNNKRINFISRKHEIILSDIACVNFFLFKSITIHQQRSSKLEIKLSKSRLLMWSAKKRKLQRLFVLRPTTKCPSLI